MVFKDVCLVYGVLLLSCWIQMLNGQVGGTPGEFLSFGSPAAPPPQQQSINRVPTSMSEMFNAYNPFRNERTEPFPQAGDPSSNPQLDSQAFRTDGSSATVRQHIDELRRPGVRVNRNQFQPGIDTSPSSFLPPESPSNQFGHGVDIPLSHGANGHFDPIHNPSQSNPAALELHQQWETSNFGPDNGVVGRRRQRKLARQQRQRWRLQRKRQRQKLRRQGKLKRQQRRRQRKLERQRMRNGVQTLTPNDFVPVGGPEEGSHVAEPGHVVPNDFVRVGSLLQDSLTRNVELGHPAHTNIRGHEVHAHVNAAPIVNNIENIKRVESKQAPQRRYGQTGHLPTWELGHSNHVKSVIRNTHTAELGQVHAHVNAAPIVNNLENIKRVESKQAPQRRYGQTGHIPIGHSNHVESVIRNTHTAELGHSPHTNIGGKEVHAHVNDASIANNLENIKRVGGNQAPPREHGHTSHVHTGELGHSNHVVRDILPATQVVDQAIPNIQEPGGIALSDFVPVDPSKIKKRRMKNRNKNKQGPQGKGGNKNNNPVAADRRKERKKKNKIVKKNHTTSEKQRLMEVKKAKLAEEKAHKIEQEKAAAETLRIAAEKAKEAAIREAQLAAEKEAKRVEEENRRRAAEIERRLQQERELQKAEEKARMLEEERARELVRLRASQTTLPPQPPRQQGLLADLLKQQRRRRGRRRN